MITIIVDSPESLERMTFHEDCNGDITPCYDGEFFTGVIIDHRGELTYNNGSLVSVLRYDQRVLH